jgi:hypothetical protein
MSLKRDHFELSTQSPRIHPTVRLCTIPATEYFVAVSVRKWRSPLSLGRSFQSLTTRCAGLASCATTLGSTLGLKLVREIAFADRFVFGASLNQDSKRKSRLIVL